MTDKFIKGTPPMVLLPAKNYVFKLNDGYFEIELPIKGTYYELDPDFFSEDSGSFVIFDEANKIVDLAVITKVLFAVSKYPDMKFNQFLVLYTVKFEENTAILTGQILDMMVTTKSDAEETEEVL